jgi:hypothetical protein
LTRPKGEIRNGLLTIFGGGLVRLEKEEKEEREEGGFFDLSDELMVLAGGKVGACRVGGN